MDHLDTATLQRLDAAHHLHPFNDNAALAKKGTRILTRGEGVYVWDSNGNKLLDAFAGLWCVNVGYGRPELGRVAAAQMTQLAYYNSFFGCTTEPTVRLAAKLAELAPGDLNHVFFSNSGSEANDTILRLVRHFWAVQGMPRKNVFIGRHNGYHGSTVAGASLGGMKGMHAMGGLPIPDIVHIDQPYWFGEGGDMDPAAFGLERARQLEAKILELGADRGDDRGETLVEQAVQALGANRSDVADEAERRIARLGDQQAAILAGDRDRDRIVGRFLVDRRDQIAADLADQHHADQPQSLGVGDAQAVAELRLLADLLHHRVDLRAAAMDEHAADADASQQQDVLGERAVQRRVDRRAAQLHDHGLAAEALDIGQGLDEDLGGQCGAGAAHDVTEFSLM